MVSINYGHFCVFTLGNTILHDQGLCAMLSGHEPKVTTNMLVGSAYTDTAKVEEYNKDLYKTLNHLVLTSVRDYDRIFDARFCRL